MTTIERQELALRRELARLRHMYQQMVGGYVRSNQEHIANIANGILSPVIASLEDLAEAISKEKDPDMTKSQRLF